MTDHWRVGRRVPKNVYVNDEVAGQFQREEWAHEAVEAVNLMARLARLADVIHARYGTQVLVRYNAAGHPVRDYGADLDVVEAALPVTESSEEQER